MLKDCITDRFSKTKQIEELFIAEQPELELLQEAIVAWMKELHILTCNRDIELWEEEFMLDHNTALTLEQRRARIFAKKCCRRIPKIQFLQDTIKTLLNAKNVIIAEGNCEFEVYVETIGLIDNFTIAEDFFRDVRPAHWGYHFINALRRPTTFDIYQGVVVFTHKRFEMEVTE